MKGTVQMHCGKGMRWRKELWYLLLSSLPSLYYFASDIVSSSLRSETLLTEVNYANGIAYFAVRGGEKWISVRPYPTGFEKSGRVAKGRAGLPKLHCAGICPPVSPYLPGFPIPGGYLITYDLTGATGRRVPDQPAGFRVDPADMEKTAGGNRRSTA